METVYQEEREGVLTSWALLIDSLLYPVEISHSVSISDGDLLAFVKDGCSAD